MILLVKLILSTAGEAIQTIQKQKRFSQKINYDVLNSLKEGKNL